MPDVTVIVPVYNAGSYLRECLDSLLGQTLRAIEILCVDDGSADESPTILREYAEKDGRVRVLTQSNQGAGAARNRALESARGRYLSFMDADDFAEPTMLEDAYRQCVRDSADVGLFRARHYDIVTGDYRPAEWLLKMDRLPAVIPFSRKDAPDHLLGMVTTALWNKLFRRAFIVEHSLRFQEISRANDLLFGRLALVRAERITVIDKVLVNYRVGSPDSLQESNHQSPFDFITAFLALKGALIEGGEFGELERGFVNDALSHCLYNLDSLKTPDSFRLLYDKLKSEAFDELGISGRNGDYFFDERHYERYRQIATLPFDEYLFSRTRVLRGQLDAARASARGVSARHRRAKSRLARVETSRSYRLGRLLTAVPRKVRALISLEKRAV